MKKRDMVAMVILYILVPFYAIYWYCSFQNQLKKETGEGFGGFGHLMATIFTFGIYALVWNFTVGGRIQRLGGKNDGVLYLVLSLFGFGFIGHFLMQNEVNNI